MSSKFYRNSQLKTTVSDVEALQTKIIALQSVITRTMPLIYLLDATTVNEFDEGLTLDFPKYTQNTDIKIESKKISFVSSPLGAKVKISIRLMYNWRYADYAPRFKYNLVVNNVVVISDSSDVNDSSDSNVKNVSNIVFVHNFLKNDVVEITLSKPSGDDSIIIFKNSNIEFNYV